MLGMTLPTYVNMLKNGANIVDTENQNVSRYAMIKDSVCIGITLWDGNTDTWTPPENITIIKLENNSPVDPGWIYNDNIWAPPPHIEILEDPI